MKTKKTNQESTNSTQKNVEQNSSSQTQAGQEQSSDTVEYRGETYKYNDHLSNYLFMGIDTRN